MRILTGGRWRDGYLDYWCGQGDVRLRVLAMQNVERLDDLFFVRSRSPRLVINYLLDRGVVDVVRKVRSRLRESARNEKFLSYGVGLVLDAPHTAEMARLSPAAFVAPMHPACLERIVVAAELVTPLREDQVPASLRSATEAGSNPPVRHLPLESGLTPAVDVDLGGWTSGSGHRLSERERAALRALSDRAVTADWNRAHLLEPGDEAVVTRSNPTRRRAGRRDRPTGVLFGFGNYAKTTILPNIERDIDVRTVHELDPLQIPPSELRKRGWDTAPGPADDEPFDVLVSAGYHSMHAPHAVDALGRGADVVLEKPVAVNEAQLQALLEAMSRESGRVFCCFQRRYSPFNDFAMKDLEAEPGEPISYHCIVYEVPLPAHHWYRWSASGSRLVSNGCHWVDHFLYLNEFSPVLSHRVLETEDRAVHSLLELENGASFSMVLTDVGSERLGVRDHVELRRGARTVVIEDNKAYRAESSAKTLRRARTSKRESYRRMYRQIGEAVRSGSPGDTAHSVAVTARTVLELEADLRGVRQSRAGSTGDRMA